MRFSSDATVTSRGFSASYVAVYPFDGEGVDEMESDSSEMTPFPGYLQSVIVSAESYGNENEDNENEDNENEDDYDEYDRYISHRRGIKYPMNRI